jgi:hypothetical protein
MRHLPVEITDTDPAQPQSPGDFPGYSAFPAAQIAANDDGFYGGHFAEIPIEVAIAVKGYFLVSALV